MFFAFPREMFCLHLFGFGCYLLGSPGCFVDFELRLNVQVACVQIIPNISVAGQFCSVKLMTQVVFYFVVLALGKYE